MTNSTSSITVRVFFTAIWLFALNYVLKYFLNAYIAHHVPIKIYGDFSLAIQFMTMSVPIYLLGANASLIKYLPRYLSSGDDSTRNQHLIWLLNTIEKSLLISFPVIVIAVIAMMLLHYSGVHSLHKYHLAVLFQFVSPLVGLISLIALILLAMRATVLANLSTKTIKHLILIPLLFVFFSFVDEKDTNALGLFFVYLFGVLFWFFITIILLFGKVGFDIKKYFSTSSPKNAILEKEWSLYGRLLLFNSTIYSLTGFLDLLIIEMINYRGERNVGFFAAIFTIAGMIWVPILAIRQVLKPVLAIKGNDVAKQHSLDLASLLQFGLLFITTLIVTIFAKVLLGHFGPDYVKYSDLLRVAIIGNAVALLPSLCFFDPIYNGYEKVLLVQNYAVIAMTAVIGALGYYYFGLTGIIWAVILIRIIVGYSLFIYVKTKATLKYMYFI